MIRPLNIPMRKSIWLREELPISDELEKLIPALREEFLNYHTDFIDGDFVNGKPYRNDLFDTNNVQSSKNAWKIDPIKYSHPDAGIFKSGLDHLVFRNRFPTAVALTEKWGEDCPISSYSILEKNAVITRHTGIENRSGEYVRIHIPLLVPEGDIFFEVEGVEIDWSDIFAFDNQFVHSAHNYSNYRRLVYLLDIKRSALGIEPGEPTDFTRYDSVEPFVRGKLPKLYHSCQIQKKEP
jgi:hypothetical protein